MTSWSNNFILSSGEKRGCVIVVSVILIKDIRFEPVYLKEAQPSKNDVDLKISFPEFCQKIACLVSGGEVLSFYLTVNFSYVSYISPTTHILLPQNFHPIHPIVQAPLLSDQFSSKNCKTAAEHIFLTP